MDIEKKPIPKKVRKEEVTQVIDKINAYSNTSKKNLICERKATKNFFEHIETNFKILEEDAMKVKKMINHNNRIIEENVKNQQSNQKEKTIMNKEKVLEEINKIKKTKFETNKEFFVSSAQTRFELGLLLVVN